MTELSRHVTLSLVSHTNVGKTTLARTLLGRDVGSVRDAPHVTEFADGYTLVEAADGARLRLWDTPGFGDSVRLVKRLRASGQPLGWLLSQVWDRWRDRAFWASQQALRHVRAETDVLLYLVNASESPAAAGYVTPEMELLAWTGKPVIVLLNQLGAPRAPSLEAADVARWRDHLAGWPQVRSVLALDAFARCWVQEDALLRAVEQVLLPPQRAWMTALRGAWREQQQHQFDTAMAALAASLARCALASQTVPDAGGLMAQLKRAGGVLGGKIGGALGLGAGAPTPMAVAQRALAEQLDAELRANTTELITLHGLAGHAEGEILNRLSSQVDARLAMDEGRAALWGGVVSGALLGLKADLLSGGLTLGGGLIAGALVGALGGVGLAKCVNLVRGTEQSWVQWNPAALDALAEAALLRYLAVAHFGRGRGDWAAGEAAPHWREVVAQALAPQRDAIHAVWSSRGDRPEAAELSAALQPLLSAATLAALAALYPNRGFG